jgi:hypothetical protein
MENYIVDIRKHTTPLHYKFACESGKVGVLYKGMFNQPSKVLPG